jgi:hypothetical protein
MKLLFGKHFFSRFDFFPAYRSHKMMSHEGLTFFRFFWISYAWFETHMKWQRPKTPARAQAVRIPIFPHLFIEEMTCFGSKHNFSKKSGCLLFSAEVQNHPGSSEIGRTCTKFKKYLWRPPQKNESWYAYPRWSIIYVGRFSQLSISRFGSCFIKNPISVLRKWKKQFSWYETKISLRGVLFHPKGHAHVWYGLVLTNYAMLMAESSPFNLKVMQPRTW